MSLTYFRHPDGVNLIPVDSGNPFPVTLSGGQSGPIPTSDVSRVPLLHARASYTATPTGLPTPPAGATYAVIQCEGGVVKWTDDGSAPTATLGLTLSDGGELRYNGNIPAVRIASKSGSPALCVAYYR